jgi:hypothetical protein
MSTMDRAAQRDGSPLDILLVRDVAREREKPCNDCPFLRTSQFAGEIVRRLAHQLGRARAEKRRLKRELRRLRVAGRAAQ